MNRYGKLVHLEIHRFRYFLLGLMALTFVVQTTALIWKTLDKVALIRAGRHAPHSFYGNDKLSFAWMVFSTQEAFAVPVLVSIAALLLYVFLIWYREWFGRSTFIYRLLMLPTARRNLYLSKLTAILLFVFAMLSFQLLALAIEQLIFRWIVPADLWGGSPFTDAILSNQAFELLLPLSGVQFVCIYGLGALALTVLFTAILLERSYRVWGVGYAIAYTAACAAAVIAPLSALGAGREDAFLYPREIFAIELAVCLLVAAVSVGLGFRLLNKKVAV
mgnify:CR=1 FL=1